MLGVLRNQSSILLLLLGGDRIYFIRAFAHIEQHVAFVGGIILDETGSILTSEGMLK